MTSTDMTAHTTTTTDPRNSGLNERKDDVYPKRKILFLGETARADAQTWINGLVQFGNFEFVTWELNQAGVGLRRLLRLFEYLFAPITVRLIARRTMPDMIIAERATSYGFLAALSGQKPLAVAQQGITDVYPPGSPLLPVKKFLQDFAFRKADLLHAWGPAMANTMQQEGADMKKVMVLPKGIDLSFFFFDAQASRFTQKITAIVTRSLLPDYRHEVIINAFYELKKRGLDTELLIAGQGYLKPSLIALRDKLGMQQEIRFLGRINNIALPNYLNRCNFYVSMPVTEGVSASLFEAMACGCYPVVSDLPGNQAWIKPGVNGELVKVDDYMGLANVLETAWKKQDHRIAAGHANRKFVEEHANYAINMRLISHAYHQLINH